MRKAIEPRQTLSTLAELYSGNRCPHANICRCRTSDWCAHAKEAKAREESHYPMLHLAGCSMGNDRCCCVILDEIESLAKDYIKRFGVVEPPVPLEIVYQCDTSRPIELRLLPLNAYFGCVWFMGNEWVIHLNSNNHSHMNRFTAFHEGFHIVCSNSGLCFSKMGKRYDSLNERLADYFAASILMPRDFVLERWPYTRQIDNMASLFDVPEWIMQDWLIRLGLIDRKTLQPC